MGDREGAPAECQPLAGERRREEQAEDEAAAAGARAEDQGVMDAVGGEFARDAAAARAAPPPADAPLPPQTRSFWR